MAASATIRVRPETRERLKRLGRGRGLSTPELLDSLVREAEDDQLISDHEAAMGGVMSDPTQAAAYRAELTAWDGALLDGLKDL